MISVMDPEELRSMYEEVVAFAAKHLGVEVMCTGEPRDPVFLHGDLVEALAAVVVERAELRKEAERLRKDSIHTKAQMLALESSREQSSRDNARSRRIAQERQGV